MNRTLEQWAAVRPDAFLEGSIIQARNVIEMAQQDIAELGERVQQALDFATRYGQIDGAHHKTWTIDQIVRALTGDIKEYEKVIREYEDGEDGPNTYEWDQGIAP